MKNVKSEKLIAIETKAIEAAKKVSKKAHNGTSQIKTKAIKEAVQKNDKKELVPYIADEVKATEEERIEILKTPVEEFESLAKITRTVTAKATVKKVQTTKGPGVIASIVKLIEASERKGTSKAEILEQLCIIFPEHLAIKLKSTINTQLGGRINKERFPLEKLEGGFFRKVMQS